MMIDRGRNMLLAMFLLFVGCFNLVVAASSFLVFFVYYRREIKDYKEFLWLVFLVSFATFMAVFFTLIGVVRLVEHII